MSCVLQEWLAQYVRSHLVSYTRLHSATFYTHDMYIYMYKLATTHIVMYYIVRHTTAYTLSQQSCAVLLMS